MKRKVYLFRITAYYETRALSREDAEDIALEMPVEQWDYIEVEKLKEIEPCSRNCFWNDELYGCLFYLDEKLKDFDKCKKFKERK